MSNFSIVKSEAVSGSAWNKRDTFSIKTEYEYRENSSILELYQLFFEACNLIIDTSHDNDIAPTDILSYCHTITLDDFTGIVSSFAKKIGVTPEIFMKKVSSDLQKFIELGFKACKEANSHGKNQIEFDKKFYKRNLSPSFLASKAVLDLLIYVLKQEIKNNGNEETVNRNLEKIQPTGLNDHLEMLVKSTGISVKNLFQLSEELTGTSLKYGTLRTGIIGIILTDAHQQLLN